MDDQTTPPGGTATAAPEEPRGPRVTGEEVRDFARLRRTRTDRYVAGVAGGLGRHLDVDPTVVRVVLAVLTLFGGAGLVLYLAVWLLVPEDGADRAPLDLGADVARVLVIGAAVVAALIVLGIPWGGGSGWPWVPWPLLVVAVLVVWLVTRRREQRGARHEAQGPETYAAAPVPPAAPAAPAAGSPPPAWTPPPAAWTPPPPARPRRTGPVLLWPTLAVVTLAFGVLGLVDVAYDLPVSAYPALALTVVGLALLVGAFVGRPGGLIALGLVTSLALGAASVAERVDAYGPYGSTVAAPTSAAAVRTTDDGTYAPPSGDFTLDLTRVEDLAALDGETVAVRMDVGSLTVRLPDEGLNVEVDGTVRYAGEVRVDGAVVAGGLGRQQGDRTLGADPDDPTLRLDVEVGTGQVDVVRDGDR